MGYSDRSRKYKEYGTCEKCGDTKQLLHLDKRTGLRLGTCCYDEQIDRNEAELTLERNERSLAEFRKWVRK